MEVSTVVDTLPPDFVPTDANGKLVLIGNFGARVDYKHGVKFQNVFTLDENININTGTTSGSKIGNSSTQKLGFWGATPIVKPTVTGAKSGNAALTDLIYKLATAGLIVDSTT